MHLGEKCENKLFENYFIDDNVALPCLKITKKLSYDLPKILKVIDKKFREYKHVANIINRKEENKISEISSSKNMNT